MAEKICFMCNGSGHLEKPEWTKNQKCFWCYGIGYIVHEPTTNYKETPK